MSLTRAFMEMARRSASAASSSQNAGSTETLVRCPETITDRRLGRPFIGVPFRLAHDLFGGSVAAYTGLNLVFFTVTVLAVFALVRLLVPRYPVLAWVGAVL